MGGAKAPKQTSKLARPSRSSNASNHEGLAPLQTTWVPHLFIIKAETQLASIVSSLTLLKLHLAPFKNIEKVHSEQWSILNNGQYM